MTTHALTPAIAPMLAAIHGLAEVVGGWLRDLGRLVVPVACPGCGLPDVRWCGRCAALLSAAPRRVERSAPRLDRLDGVAPLPVWALAPYAGGVREVVVAWKDRGRVDLDGLLGPPVRRAARGIAGSVAGPVAAAVLTVPVLVVPAPSTAGATRARGREHVRGLAHAVARGLRDGGVPAVVVPALARRGRGRDQVGLGARDRARNLAGAVVVRPRVLARATPAAAGPACVLVDDVLTTGATLAAAERALEEAGADVVGALVVAATPPPGTVTGPAPKLTSPRTPSPVSQGGGRG